MLRLNKHKAKTNAYNNLLYELDKMVMKHQAEIIALKKGHSDALLAMKERVLSERKTANEMAAGFMEMVDDMLTEVLNTQDKKKKVSKSMILPSVYQQAGLQESGQRKPSQVNSQLSWWTCTNSTMIHR